MFDVNKYVGLWYEIARTPNFFEEEGAKNIRAEYKLNADGTINVLNTETRKDGKIYKIKGIASPADNMNKTLFSANIKFEGIPYPGDYNVMGIEEEYKISIVYSVNGKNLWILSRNKKISRETISIIMRNLIKSGYAEEVNALTFTLQE